MDDLTTPFALSTPTPNYRPSSATASASSCAASPCASRVVLFDPGGIFVCIFLYIFLYLCSKAGDKTSLLWCVLVASVVAFVMQEEHPSA